MQLKISIVNNPRVKPRGLFTIGSIEYHRVCAKSDNPFRNLDFIHMPLLLFHYCIFQQY
jgi:hypothetical protein